MPCSRWTTRLAFVQFAEIDLRALRAELCGALQTAPSVRRRAAEEFRRGEHDEIGRRKTEAAGERSFDQVDSA